MIKLLGIPFDDNSSYLKGHALAPPLIRLIHREGSSNAFSEHGIEILEGKTYEDLGDMVFSNTNSKDAYLAIRHRIQDELNDGSKILSFGGDHSISFPVIEEHASKYKDLHVLHLDAHADLYDNFDDNPYSHASPFARLMEKNMLASLTQVGIRTLNTHQREQAKYFGVDIIEMKDFNYDFLHTLRGPLYISLDMDVLDPAFAPGVSHHEPGGMTVRDLLNVIQHISVPVIGADIVEYNPVRDVHNMTAMVVYKLFKELVSKMV